MLDDDEKENGMILLYEFDYWSLVMLSLHLIEIFIIIEYIPEYLCVGHIVILLSVTLHYNFD